MYYNYVLKKKKVVTRKWQKIWVTHRLCRTFYVFLFASLGQTPNWDGIMQRVYVVKYIYN